MSLKGHAYLTAHLHITPGSAAYTGKLKSITGKSLLILDDFRLTPYEADEKSILFDILDKRYKRKITIIFFFKGHL